MFAGRYLFEVGLQFGKEAIPFGKIVSSGYLASLNIFGLLVIAKGLECYE